VGKGTKSRHNFDRGYRRVFGEGKRATGTFVLRDGKLVRARGGLDSLRKRDSKNIRSLSIGVQAFQVPEATKKITDAGLGDDMHYAPDGDVVFKDRNAKLKCLKKLGYFDRDEVRG